MTREEAIDIIKCLAWHTRPDEEDVEQAIKALEQEPKTGHWIVAKGNYLGRRNACCSNCKDFYTNDWNVMDYCPHCGAKMVEPQESEDKEQTDDKDNN